MNFIQCRKGILWRSSIFTFWNMYVIIVITLNNVVCKHRWRSQFSSISEYDEIRYSLQSTIQGFLPFIIFNIIVEVWIGSEITVSCKSWTQLIQTQTLFQFDNLFSFYRKCKQNSQNGPFWGFGGTENGTSGAWIKILRPLFNTNTPPKTPI